MTDYREYLNTLIKEGKRFEAFINSNGFKEFILDDFCSEYLNKNLEQGTRISNTNREDYLLLVQAVGIFKNFIKDKVVFYEDVNNSLKQLDEETND